MARMNTNLEVPPISVENEIRSSMDTCYHIWEKQDALHKQNHFLLLITVLWRAAQMPLNTYLYVSHPLQFNSNVFSLWILI